MNVAQPFKAGSNRSRHSASRQRRRDNNAQSFHSVATRRRCRWILPLSALKGRAKFTRTLRVSVYDPTSVAKPPPTLHFEVPTLHPASCVVAPPNSNVAVPGSNIAPLDLQRCTSDLHRRASELKRCSSKVHRCTSRPPTLHLQTSNVAPPDLQRCTFKPPTLHLQTSNVAPPDLQRRSSELQPSAPQPHLFQSFGGNPRKPSSSRDYTARKLTGDGVTEQC